jgi:hypothetical protein
MVAHFKHNYLASEMSTVLVRVVIPQYSELEYKYQVLEYWFSAVNTRLLPVRLPGTKYNVAIPVRLVR